MFAPLLPERPKAKARTASSEEPKLSAHRLAEAGYYSATPRGPFNSTELETEADRIADDVVENTAPGPGIERLRPAFGYDLSHIRLHADESAAVQASARRARAFTRGNDIFFSRGALRPDTRWGLRLLAHEIAHTFQQADGKVPAGTIQNEDWNFTPEDYAKLTAPKTKFPNSQAAAAFDLTFGGDSAWLPAALQDNLLTTLKFVLTAKNPARTTGISETDFYHGHFVIPRDTQPKLSAKVGNFNRERDKLEFEALEGKKYEGKESSSDVTAKNIGAYAKATQEIEKLATPLVNEALAVPGAAVMYHTFEHNRPPGMGFLDPTRHIITPLGGTPRSYIPPAVLPPECPEDVKAHEPYLCVYERILDFAFLVDAQGIVHVRPGTATGRVFSTITGRTP